MQELQQSRHASGMFSNSAGQQAVLAWGLGGLWPVDPQQSSAAKQDLLKAHWQRWLCKIAAESVDRVSRPEHAD